MIKINDTQYADDCIKITWKNFNTSNASGKKRFGKAPLITFCLEKNISVELEFTFSQAMFLDTKTNIRTNIKEYVSDIIFKNDKGCTSLIYGKYDCNITRINEKKFNLDFYVEEKEISIFINTNIDLF